MLYISSDHGGFKLKSELVSHLKKNGVELVDLGPAELIAEDDYPDYVYPLTQKVLEDVGLNKGIVICRNGIGVCVFANKVKGIRAGLSWKPEHAATSRTDDDTNVLALPADFITKSEAEKIVETWINTQFSNEARHLRRLEKIARFEREGNSDSGL